MNKIRWGNVLGLLLALLIFASAPVQAQDNDDVDSLAAIQQSLRNFADWWHGTQTEPVRDIAMSRIEDGAFVMGNPNAPITLVEFADFACPHCQRYRPSITQFIDTYVMTGMAKLEFRFFPTAGGQLTVLAAQAAECADEQQPGAFWQAHDQLYEYALGGTYNDKIPAQLIRDLRLDGDALRACMATADQVAIDVEFGRALGVSGTPAVLVRYGNGLPQFIELDGRTYNAGGPTFDVLSAIVVEGQYR